MEILDTIVFIIILIILGIATFKMAKNEQEAFETRASLEHDLLDLQIDNERLKSEILNELKFNLKKEN